MIPFKCYVKVSAKGAGVEEIRLFILIYLTAGIY